jgi:hypothetical protein
MKESFQRDAGVFLKRCGSLYKEMRESFQRDAGVFPKRCGSLSKEMWESFQRDAGVFPKRCGSLFIRAGSPHGAPALKPLYKLRW